MYCMACGTQVEEGTRFCTNCGTAAGVEMTTSPLPEQQPPAVQQQAPAPRGIDIAKASLGYRGIVLSYGSAFLIWIFVPLIVPMDQLQAQLHLSFAPLLPVSILALGLVAFFSYFLASAIGKSGIIWAIAGAIPIVSLFAMLLLLNASNKSLKAAGYKIGFLGRVTKNKM